MSFVKRYFQLIKNMYQGRDPSIYCNNWDQRAALVLLTSNTFFPSVPHDRTLFLAHAGGWYGGYLSDWSIKSRRGGCTVSFLTNNFFTISPATIFGSGPSSFVLSTLNTNVGLIPLCFLLEKYKRWIKYDSSHSLKPD